MKPPRDFVPRLISGGPEAIIDRSKREFLRASAALLVALNLPQTLFAGGGQHGVGGSGLVFENPDEVNPLPALDDLPGGSGEVCVAGREWLR
jgi:hypothetical protein